MAFTLDNSFINQYSANVHMLLSERGSKLMGLFPTEDGKPGEFHMFETFKDEVGTTDIIARGDAVISADPTHNRRIAQRTPSYKAYTVYDMDQAKLLIDPTAIYTENAVRLHGVRYDRMCINALLGTALTGKSGGTPVSFDNTNQQIAHGSAGFTVAKFNQALRILETNNVDIEAEDIYLLISGRAVEDLMGETNFTSFDFMNEKTLAGKTLPKFRGVNIVRINTLPDYTAGSVFRGIMCTRDALKVAMWDMFKASSDKLVSVAGQPIQIYTESSFGAVRMEEGLVVDVLYQ